MHTFSRPGTGSTLDVSGPPPEMGRKEPVPSAAVALTAWMVGGVVIETVPDTLIPLAIEIVLRWLPPSEALTRELPEPTPTNSEPRKLPTSIVSVPAQLRGLALAAIGVASRRSTPSTKAESADLTLTIR
jgi:hypothetical protein